MLSPFAVKTIDTLTTAANSKNDGNTRERITIKFNVINAAVLGTQNKTAEVNFVHLIEIIKKSIRFTISRLPSPELGSSRPSR